MSYRKKYKDEQLYLNARNVILSAWHSREEEGLRYFEIRDLVLKNLIFKSRQNTQRAGEELKLASVERRLKRYLNQLVKDRFLTKKEKKYFLSGSIDEYRLFSYVDQLRERYENRGLSSEFSVEGFVTRLCVGTSIPMPALNSLKLDEKFAIQTIDLALALFFHALRDLRNKVMMRRSGIPMALSDTTLRMTLLAALIKELGLSNISNEQLFEELKPMLPHSTPLIEKVLNESKDGMEGIAEHILEYIMGSLHPQGYLDVDNLHKSLEERKDKIKETYDLDVDRLTTERAVVMYRDYEKKLDNESMRYFSEHKKYRKMPSSYYFRPKDSEQLSLLQMVMAIKVTEYFAKMGVDWEDFAIIMTPHPNAMYRYYTPAMILRDEVKSWKRLCSIDDELLKYFASLLLTSMHEMVDALRKEGSWRVEWIGLSKEQFNRIFEHYDVLLKKLIKTGTRPEVALSESKLEVLRKKNV